MFDAHGRITLVNHRYIEMYKLDENVVKPGLTLRELIQHRKDTGLFTGDVDAYVAKIMGGMTQRQERRLCGAGQRRPHRARAQRAHAGRRLGLDPRGRHRSAARRARARRDQGAGERRTLIDSAIATFRPHVEKLLSSVGESAAAMRSTATSLFDASGQTSQHAEGAVHAFHEASTNVETAAVAADELSRSIAEISRQLSEASNIVEPGDV